MVGVIGNAALFVGLDLVAVYDPLDSRAAIDDVLVGLVGDVFYGDLRIVDDGVLLATLDELHLLDTVVDGLERSTIKTSLNLCGRYAIY